MASISADTSAGIALNARYSFLDYEASGDPRARSPAWGQSDVTEASSGIVAVVSYARRLRSGAMRAARSAGPMPASVPTTTPMRNAA